MDTVDVIIIGAGVVGLAISEKLSSYGKEIVLVEKNDGFGRETSSRNSEVIHAGLYYPKESLKAKLCVQGNRMLYELCENNGIPYKKTGKIIAASTEEEINKIHTVLEQGKKNGVFGLRLLTKSEAEDLEPNIICKVGILSSESGIVDTHQLMKYLEQKSEARGVTIAYNCEVIGLHKKGRNDNFILDIIDADHEQMQLCSPVVINASGLGCDKIAVMAGIDIDEAGYRIHPCKGEYFSISNRHKGIINHLIYPAPTQISLGTHAVMSLDGRLKLGPNAFYVDSIDYDVDPSHQQDFFNKAVKFLPFIEYSDLMPDLAGIRPKLQVTGEDFRDFIIKEESGNGLKGLINLIGIESPGLTACLAIACMVDRLIRKI